MTARSDHQSAADEWRGGWINFYQYRGGQAHFGNVVSATRQEADAVRAAWFAASEEYTKHGLVLAYWIPTGEVYDIMEVFDRISVDHPNVAKAKNCTFSIAVPHGAPDE